MNNTTFEIELSRNNVTPATFLSYVRRMVDNKGGKYIRSDLDLEYFKAGADLNYNVRHGVDDNRVDLSGVHEKSVSKPYEMQTYIRYADGSVYNEICEFEFDDDKTGHGYYYLVNVDAEPEPETPAAPDFGNILYKDGKYFDVVDQAWHRMPLKNGNTKLGKNVYTWSMLPGCNNGGTCCCNCAGCYAMAGRYVMESVKACLAYNTRLARYRLEYLESVIELQLAHSKSIKYVRIHAAGDFFSGEYVKMWTRIAARHTDIVFWTYTKAWQRGFDAELIELNSQPNVNIVDSLVDKRLNFGHAGYIVRLYNELKQRGENVHICRCGIDRQQHCNTCHACANCKHVLFLEHGTEYKPGKEDPDDMAAFEAIANSAENMAVM